MRNDKEKYLFEGRVPDTDEKRKDSFSMKIGGTVYDVTTHLKTEGKRTVLNQFKALLLASQYRGLAHLKKHTERSEVLSPLLRSWLSERRF